MIWKLTPQIPYIFKHDCGQTILILRRILPEDKLLMLIAHNIFKTPFHNPWQRCYMQPCDPKAHAVNPKTKLDTDTRMLPRSIRSSSYNLLAILKSKEKQNVCQQQFLLAYRRRHFMNIWSEIQAMQNTAVVLSVWLQQHSCLWALLLLFEVSFPKACVSILE